MWGFISVLGCCVANDNILNMLRLPSAIKNYKLLFIQPWPTSGKVLQFVLHLRLLLIIHRHLFDDSDDSPGFLHAIPGNWSPGGGGRGTVWKSEGGGGCRSCFWRPPPWLIGLPPVGGRSTQQWSGERNISACPVFSRQGAVRPLGELSLLVLWEGLGHSVTVTPYKVS